MAVKRGWLWRFVGGGLMIAVIAAVLLNAWMQRYLDTPMSLGEQGLEYRLPRGGSLSKAAYQLSRQGVLSCPRCLSLYSRVTGKGQSIMAGDYLFPRGTTPRQMLDKLQRGDVRYFELTLVEGWNLRQVINSLRSAERLTHTLPENTNTVTAAQLEIETSYPSLEGLLFPDTYRYHSGSTDVELLRQAYQRMQQVLAEEWQDRAADLPYSSPYEALIMASLVEKETGVAVERQQIAGVFVRRLRKGMRLQTDPTIIYGLGRDFDGNLRSRHLKDASNPYNTYRHSGLTPTPIALAGREAIYAALHPAAGDTLYFVAKGDGSHYFSKTLQEHQRAVRKYQINQRRKDYSSAPRANKSS